MGPLTLLQGEGMVVLAEAVVEVEEEAWRFCDRRDLEERERNGLC